MALITCPECGKELSERALTCTNCGVKISNGHTQKANKVLVISLLFFAVCCVIAMIVIAPKLSNTPPTNTSGSVQTGYATIDKFNQIEMGMTYEEVVKIMGSEGTVMSESEILDINTSIYYWYSKSGFGNMNIMIQDGQVITKAQVGLY